MNRVFLLLFYFFSSQYINGQVTPLQNIINDIDNALIEANRFIKAA